MDILRVFLFSELKTRKSTFCISCNCIVKYFITAQNLVFSAKSFLEQLCLLFRHAASNTGLYYSRGIVRLSFGGTECAMN